ncbi:MAG: ABC transporter ATP-binding protein [Pirellulaceae bacterium]
MTSMIETKGLKKNFGRNQVLQDVTLSVPPGCVFALLGDNGAGKSTLIRGLMGYLRFDSGEASVLGFDPYRQTLELRRRVGYVSDAPAFYEWMTVREVAQFTSAFYDDSFLRNFVVHAQGFALPVETRIKDLSKGMKSKLALALMMAARPQLMILDEPTSGLDPFVRRSFLESMVDVAGSGRTVFVASHQIHEIERVADVVAFLKDGQIKAVGPLDQLKTEIQSLTFSRKDSLLRLSLPLERLDVLSESHAGRTSSFLIRDLTNEVIGELRNDQNVFDIQVARPSLEELYMGLSFDSHSTQTAN